MPIGCITIRRRKAQPETGLRNQECLQSGTEIASFL